ncbi:hypothetical protein [Actinomadura oligospora]|uniref:hypothetical protein n=1 Tax=Actinomadura oligospora TaxID=111804 RepID=UPI000687509D|nr:hypothetical protein [Actinomadura oligospora]
MAEFPKFGVLLMRLLDHRGLSTSLLSQAAEVPEDELQGVIDGCHPSPTLLQALAPALDLHAADLFVMAGQPVPDELAPLDASAGQQLDHLVPDVICLPAEQRSWMLQMVRDLPQEPRGEAYAGWRVYDPTEAGFGAVIGNMLLTNRNLAGRAAVALACCSNGRMYVSSSTVFRIAAGKTELTPDRLANLATLIDIPAGDLAALTGIALPDQQPPDDPAAADVAALLWEVRRLSAAQMRLVCEQARDLRREIPDDAIDRKFYATGSYLHSPLRGQPDGGRAQP